MKQDIQEAMDAGFTEIETLTAVLPRLAAVSLHTVYQLAFLAGAEWQRAAIRRMEQEARAADHA